MKMIQGTGTISNYPNYTRNCTEGQLPYKIPVSSLTDVQLYIDIGTTKPTTIQYEIIHTCGALAGTVEALAATDYVIGQDSNQRWYGVFKGLTGGTDLKCFVVAITLDSTIYFSDEYCIDECEDSTAIEGCYGNLDSNISTDCNGIYFGVHSGLDDPLGDTSVVYRHKVFLRSVEVTLLSIKNTFKQGRTRSFRTEKEKVHLFWSEIVPEWYLEFIDAVFYRGEVSIEGTRYLLNETQYELVDDCLKQWKPTSTFRDSCYQSFSCEDDPCAAPPESCCDPVFVSATVDTITEESQSSGYPPVTEGNAPIVVVEGTVDGTIVVSGTSDPVTGITDTSVLITCNAFAGQRVFIIKGGLPLPGIDPGGGQPFYTKNLADNFITFSSGWVGGEYIYIETIP